MTTWVALDAAAFRFTNDRFGVFSNFSYHPLWIHGRHKSKVPHAEHLYQMLKFVDPDKQLRIADAPNAYEAAKLGRSMRIEVPDWQATRIVAMRYVLHTKIQCHWDALVCAFEASGGRNIVESSTHDRFWGAEPCHGGVFRGENMLGCLWMELRSSWRGGELKLQRIPGRLPLPPGLKLNV